MRHFPSLALLALLASPLLAQTTTQDGPTSELVYTSGPRITREGLYKRAGTSGSGSAMDWVPGVAGLWDLGDTRSLIKGGYDLNGTTQYFSRTASVPVTTTPFWVVCWFKADTVASTQILFYFSNSTDTGSYGGGIDDTSGQLIAFQNDDDENGLALTTGSITAGRAQCGIFVFASSASRSVYSDTDTTGATETTDVEGTTGIDRVFVGNGFSGGFFNGVVAATWVFSGAGPSSAQRSAIFAGYDPERVMSARATALWKLDNDNGADSRGNYTLTATASPSAVDNLYVARDGSGGGRHLRSTTAIPTWSSSIGNGQGGAVFASASSQFLLVESTASAVPFQVYVVAQANNVTARHALFYMGDKDATDDDFWTLGLAGDVGGDPVRANAQDSGTGTLDTSSGYSADTDYLLWFSAASSTSRTVELNGASTGTNATDRSPDNADRMGIGILLDATPSSPLDGEEHWVLLLNNSSTANQPRIERFASRAWNLGF